jgi:hypothetical protein
MSLVFEISNRFIQVDDPVADFDIKPAFGVYANPSLVVDRRSLSTVV